MMLGAKGILTHLIPDCSALRAPDVTRYRASTYSSASPISSSVTVRSV